MMNWWCTYYEFPLRFINIFMYIVQVESVVRTNICTYIHPCIMSKVWCDMRGGNLIFQCILEATNRIIDDIAWLEITAIIDEWNKQQIARDGCWWVVKMMMMMVVVWNSFISSMSINTYVSLFGFLTL